jgi:hypothetical protein
MGNQMQLTDDASDASYRCIGTGPRDASDRRLQFPNIQQYLLQWLELEHDS